MTNLGTCSQLLQYKKDLVMNGPATHHPDFIKPMEPQCMMDPPDNDGSLPSPQSSTHRKDVKTP